VPLPFSQLFILFFSSTDFQYILVIYWGSFIVDQLTVDLDFQYITWAGTDNLELLNELSGISTADEF